MQWGAARFSRVPEWQHAVREDLSATIVQPADRIPGLKPDRDFFARCAPAVAMEVLRGCACDDGVLGAAFGAEWSGGVPNSDGLDAVRGFDGRCSDED